MIEVKKRERELVFQHTLTHFYTLFDTLFDTLFKYWVSEDRFSINFQEENSPQVLDDDVGKDDLLGSASISMIGILQSQVGRAKEDLVVSIDL